MRFIVLEFVRSGNWTELTRINRTQASGKDKNEQGTVLGIKKNRYKKMFQGKKQTMKLKQNYETKKLRS